MNSVRLAAARARHDFGLVEWFRPGERERAEAALDGIAATGAQWLRTHLSWAEYHETGGENWYDWLIPAIASRVELLPCVHYTPPSLSRTGLASGPPRRPKDFADFIDHVLTRYGRHFSHVELWNEPNNLLDWDWRADPDWHVFCEMVGGAAYWAEKRGWKAVLAGPSPLDLNWLSLMGERGVLGTVSAIGLHGFPGTWDSEAGIWRGWSEHVAEAREVLERYNLKAEIWLTEAGYSTWRHDETAQLRRFLDAYDAPADRLYWYGWQDVARHVPVQEGLQFDIRHYHLGMADARGREKLLGRLLRQGGVDAVRGVAAHAKAPPTRKAEPVAILGGAGFIGSNLADSLIEDGRDVLVFDNLSRPSVEANLAWLKERHGERVTGFLGDLRDEAALREALADASAVYHFAAQVAVTTSLDDPKEDFSINAGGTIAVLEALRRKGGNTPLVFASTNKVYGHLDDIKMMATELGHFPADAEFRDNGISEAQPLDFRTPYGCSKGVADQYVLDYARSYGLPAAVLRMSCIYGPRQFGTEDQGWVAHFLIRALRGEPITIYGDGAQVRDVLHVADAVAAYRGVMADIDRLRGRVFNLGGGPDNAVSLRTMLAEIERVAGRPVRIDYSDWRQGDQPYFVADTRKLQGATGWTAEIGWREGVAHLADWLKANAPLVGIPLKGEERLRA